MGISQLGGSGGTRMAMKQNAAGPALLTASATTASSGAVGSWVQVTAAAPTEYYIVGVSAFGAGTASGGTGFSLQRIYVDIATGGSGSEAVLASAVISFGSANNLIAWATGTNISPIPTAGFVPFVAPLRVASGARMAVRIATLGTAGGGTHSASVELSCVPYANVEGN